MGGALWGFCGAWELLQPQPLPLKPCVHNPAVSTSPTLNFQCLLWMQVKWEGPAGGTTANTGQLTAIMANSCFGAEGDLLLGRVCHPQ